MSLYLMSVDLKVTFAKLESLLFNLLESQDG